MGKKDMYLDFKSGKKKLKFKPKRFPKEKRRIRAVLWIFMLAILAGVGTFFATY